jgi:hypothetical protein
MATSQREIEAFISNRMEASTIYDRKATHAKSRETFYMHVWRWLGKIAQASFISGLTLLLAFAIKKT